MIAGSSTFLACASIAIEPEHGESWNYFNVEELRRGGCTNAADALMI